MKWRSLTFRLVFLYSGLLLLLGASFYFYTIVSFEQYAHETMRASLAARADEVWNTVQGHSRGDGLLANVIERRFAPEALDRFIRVSVDGAVVYASGSPSHHAFDPAKTPASHAGLQYQSSNYGHLFVVARSYVAGGGQLVTIESGQSDEFVDGVENSLGRSLLIGLPLLLLIAGGGGYVLVRRSLSPVELMIKAAEAISLNDPHNRLPLTGSGDRIEALGLALNRMLDRLDSAYQHVSRFTADAAHELRTPLAIIRGELEFVAGVRKLPADVQSAVANVLDEVSRLGGIVDSLIALSRMDSFWGERTHSAVDVSALAAETAEQMQLLAQEKNVSLNGPTGPSVLVAGDRERLKQVLVNLIDNAIKYNIPGGKVSVEVSTSADRGLIVISDTGVGIAPEDTQFIFDRFYRVSTDRGESGAGLGLAIVKSICHAHGGSVTVTSGICNGSVFLVELPLWTARPVA